MAKQDYFFRYLAIIKKLNKYHVATFKEIKSYVEHESQLYDYPILLSLRTFHRDLNEIRNLFKISIEYDHTQKAYFIAENEQSDFNNRMLESLDTINSMKVVGDVSRYMIFEKRKAQGTQHFYGLLHAIKNRIVIELKHQKFENDDPTVRNVEPYALKESHGRWYLVAKDRNGKKVKTFGLDRVADFQYTSKRFDYPVSFNVNQHFLNCFGVINPDEGAPVEIILSFDPEQGKYIKSYPIHHTQIIIQDNEDELRIKLFLFITHDLIMELLSYGDTVEIIAPAILKKSLVDIYYKAIARNSNLLPAHSEKR